MDDRQRHRRLLGRNDAPPWRELTEACDWSAEQYAEGMAKFVREALVAAHG
jgi:hypothetical protein